MTAPGIPAPGVPAPGIPAPGTSAPGIPAPVVADPSIPDAGTARRSGRTLIAAAVYAVAMAGVAFVSAWPVYAGPVYVQVAATAVVAGAGIGLAAVRWRWPWTVTLVASLLAFLTIGVALAVPPATVDPGAAPPAGILSSLRSVVLGVVTGWKDLVTVELPVGEYRNLLVPALVVFLAGTLATVILGARRTASGTLAVVAASAMPLFGLLFGRTVVSAPLTIVPFTIGPFGMGSSAGSVVLDAPRETACGAAAFVLSLGWLVWRARAQRAPRRALTARALHAADVGGLRASTAGVVRLSRRRSASDARRAVLAIGMVAVSVGVAALAGPALAQTRTREVLRSAIGPEVAISRSVTPLTDYRANFADSTADKTLFRVDAVPGRRLPDRIRIATLSTYDGVEYRVSPGDAGLFVRVPSRLSPAGDPTAARIVVDGLRGIWLPTSGSVDQVSFTGAHAADLADGFYYDASAQAAVETDPLAPGDAYTVTAAETPAPPLSSIAAPGVDSHVRVPASVKTWVQQQDAGAGGAALQTLVDRLRQRGYLSHALAVPVDGAVWMRSLGAGYTFQPSASGHSLGRIDALFQQLLARQATVRGAGAGATTAATASSASLVAGIGDDEQFAVATALIARTLGFPSRVVVGVRLSAPNGAGAGDLPVCVRGECTGRDVSVWVEVRSAAGAWVPVDVTPQHTDGVDETVTHERDPQNATEVRPQSAQEVTPPDPVQQDADTTPPQRVAGTDMSGLWATLRIAAASGLVLVILLGPLVVVLAVKALRRRSRRGESTAVGRVVAGWDEYLDVARDHGLPPPQGGTRVEIAERHDAALTARMAARTAAPPAAGAEAGAPGPVPGPLSVPPSRPPVAPGPAGAGVRLATLADRAVFSDSAVDASDSDEFWRIVDDERRRVRASVPLWRRALAAVSLTSFTRSAQLRSTRPRRRGARKERRDARTDDLAR
jgi:hypothetical protein